MENASEALIISSAVFIAIILLGMLIFAFNNSSKLQQQEGKQLSVDQLAKWNAEWEAYNRKILYGADVVNVINKARQYEEEDIEIEIKVLDKNDIEIEEDDVNKNSLYECVQFEYSSMNGKVESITFKLIE